MANIIWLSDMDMKGSGYLNITVPLCKGLAEKGHTVKILGLGYDNTEHAMPFSIIPAKDFQEMSVMVHNLSRLWNPDVIIAAMDIPWHEMIIHKMHDEGNKIPYFGIFPLESGPLCMDWAFTLMEMDAQYCISKFGTEECQKQNVPAEHLSVGLDTVSYRPPSKEEREQLREALGYTSDNFVILTIADNQERKNLGRTFEVVSAFKGLLPDGNTLVYNLVTREHFYAGWKLRSLAAREDIQISDNLRIYERGLEFKKLWALYATADAFLLLSRAEGLGMPVLEAMACGIPVVAPRACAFIEHLDNDRGILIEPEFSYPDVFGNGERYMSSIWGPAYALEWLTKNEFDTRPALEYIQARTWNIPVEQLHNKIEKEMEKTNGKAQLSE